MMITERSLQKEESQMKNWNYNTEINLLEKKLNMVNINTDTEKRNISIWEDSGYKIDTEKEMKWGKAGRKVNETNNENNTSGWGWGCRNEEKLKAITGLVERKVKQREI